MKGDNPVVDRRSITFNAKEGSIKKVDNGVDGGLIAKNSNDDVEHAGVNTGDVTPTGSSQPFIPADAYKPTPEEQGIQEHPKGCGCSVPGLGGAPGIALTIGSLGLVFASVVRRRRRKLRA